MDLDCLVDLAPSVNVTNLVGSPLKLVSIHTNTRATVVQRFHHFYNCDRMQ